MNTDSIKLREFLNNLSEHEDPTPTLEQDYSTVTAQLNSISWQLKRIADALENTQ